MTTVKVVKVLLNYFEHAGIEAKTEALGEQRLAFNVLDSIEENTSTDDDDAW